jgi:hypothetical protein
MITKGDSEKASSFMRTSKKVEVNAQGEWFMSEMNSVNMIVLNGIKSEAEYTYDHPGREAKSIVDFILVNEQTLEVVTDVAYHDCRESLCTDHILLSVQVSQEAQLQLPKRKVKRVRRKKKPIMNFLRTVTRRDGFWKCLEVECDQSLQDFTTILGQPIDKDYATFKSKLEEAVSITLKNTKPIRTLLKARLKADGAIVNLRIKKSELFRTIKAEDNIENRIVLKDQLKKVSKQLKQRTLKAINEFKREQVAEIERLEIDDCRRMWKELKRLSGWTRKDDLSDTVFDDKKQEVCGDNVEEVWKETYRKLGTEDEKDSKFDKEFRAQIVANQEMIYNQSFEPANECAYLDALIELEEVEDAIRRLKLAKAPGNDQIVAEILKRGGDQVAKSVHSLCAKAWREEKLPTEWTRGIIFPVHKDGDKRDTSNYRGITLLSIVGKVYGQVINERLTKWCEANKILVEEQGGFRPHRGCPDQLFSLVEILQNRGQKGAFCCFVDVKKAFDRVFRAGLWQKIADAGVKGKMWRVLKSIYESVESCVMVNGHLTDWFQIHAGVRQGCVLSPLLYALFINGLVEELNALNRGVAIEEGGQKLSALLYADDIVLVAANKQDLQRMLDIVASYAKKWRFELNAKKSQVVVFGMRQPPRHVKWKLGENELEQVTQYKYLGIELTRTLQWKVYLKRVLAKAKRNMTQALAMGVSGGFMTTRLANIVWMSLVRSIIEHGCEIWGEGCFVDLEKLQISMGKRILRCGSRMTEEVVRGELGWERHVARRDEMRLRYWGKLVRMGDDRIAKIIYKASRRRLEKEETQVLPLTKTWCKYTRDLLGELYLEEVWQTEAVGTEEEWNKLVRERIHEREEVKWRTQCLLRPKLRTYCKIKKDLIFEPYLQMHHRGGIPELAKIRGGSNRLRIEQGRYVKEQVNERVCRCCASGEVEDELHFLLQCSAYNDFFIAVVMKVMTQRTTLL